MRVRCSISLLVAVPGVAQPVAMPGHLVQPVFGGAPLEAIRRMTTVDSTLYVADNIAGAGGVLREFDISTGTWSVLATLPNSNSMSDLAVGDGVVFPDSKVYLTDHNTQPTGPTTYRDCCDGVVFEIDRTTGVFTHISVGNPTWLPPGDPAGLQIVTSGNFPQGLYVMDFEGASPNVPVLFRINPGFSRDTVLTNPALWTTTNSPSQLAYSSGGDYGNLMYVVDGVGSWALWTVDSGLALNGFVPTGAGLVPRDVEMAGSDAFDGLYATNGDAVGAITHVAPDGSLTNIVTDYAPVDLAVSSDGGKIYFCGLDEIWVVTCTADWNTNGTLDTSDFLAFLNDYTTAVSGGTPIHADPDLAAPSGVLNTADVLAYLNFFSSGCL